jgi:glycosyltransferase involved in cell wall biosynthesis
VAAVSVVIPLYNKAETVGRAVSSVLAQTRTDFELIVVDDGSTDAGADVVRGFRDGRVKLLAQVNAGVSAARNAGIQAARAELIAFLDADDEWRPSFLGTIFELQLLHPECAVFGTSYEIRRGGSVRRAVLRGLPEGFVRGPLTPYFVVASKSDPPLCASSVAVRRQALLDVGGFPLGIQAGEDLVTWARLAVKYRIAYSSEPLATFWAPMNAYHRPGRVPAIPDRVGEELARLLNEQRPEGFQEYLGMWHRMRGATFLQLANGLEARKELAKAIRLSSFSPSLLALLSISAFPGPLARAAYLSLRVVIASSPWRKR